MVNYFKIYQNHKNKIPTYTNRNKRHQKSTWIPKREKYSPKETIFRSNEKERGACVLIFANGFFRKIILTNQFANKVIRRKKFQNPSVLLKMFRENLIFSKQNSSDIRINKSALELMRQRVKDLDQQTLALQEILEDCFDWDIDNFLIKFEIQRIISNNFFIDGVR